MRWFFLTSTFAVVALVVGCGEADEHATASALERSEFAERQGGFAKRDAPGPHGCEQLEAMCERGDERACAAIEGQKELSGSAIAFTRRSPILRQRDGFGY